MLSSHTSTPTHQHSNMPHSKEEEEQRGSYFTEQVNHESIDYTGALLREDARRQRSEELIRTHSHMLNNTVRTGFIRDDEYEDFGAAQNNEVWFDVLPSFEMHRSLHNSASSRVSTDLPPVYTDDTASAPSLNTNDAPAQNATRTNQMSPEQASTPAMSVHSSAMTNATDLTSSLGTSNFNDYTQSSSSDPTNTHRLPKMPSNPLLSVSICVTKSLPVIGGESELESLLKEYTSGDVIHGYVVINNASSKQIPFHMFYVTMEGIVSIVDKENKKMYNRQFLHMIDLNASWSYGCISPSSNLHYKWGQRDHDGSLFGLPPSRLLEPNTKYKKFFTFKVPYNLLDNTCRHGQELHTLLPPSFGVNRYYKDGKYASIKVNDSLGYGHSGKRGSPILTCDMARGNATVSYSINSTLVGLHPTKVDAMGQPVFAVMQEYEYALRFIPFGFGVSLFSSVDSLKRLKSTVQSSLKNAERKLMLSIEGNDEEVRKLDNEIKIAQLSGQMTQYREKDIVSFPLRNEEYYATSDDYKVQTSFTYVPSTKKSLFGKKVPTSNDSGIINITTHVPKDGLPYISPSLIRKTNEISKLNALGLANYDMMNNALSANEKKKLTHLEYDLSFLPSDLGLMNSTVPPEFSEIQCKLIAINVYSKSSVPVKLSSGLFSGGGEYNMSSKETWTGFQELKDSFAKFDSELQQLKKKFEKSELDVSDFRKYVHKSVEQDVNAMKELEFDHSIHHVFKKPELVKEKSNDWVKSQDGKRWERHIQIDLEFYESIRETLIPNFQTCLLSRFYCIQAEFKFKGSDTISAVRIPIRLRWFD